MKKVGILIVTIFLSVSVYAGNTPEDVVNPILKKIQNGDHSALTSAAFPEGTPVREYISPADIKQSDTEMESYLRTMGKSYGYELFHTSSIPDVYELRYYVFKFDRQPVVAKFGIYKANKNWEMQKFSMEFSLTGDLEPAAKEVIGLSAAGFGK